MEEEMKLANMISAAGVSLLLGLGASAVTPISARALVPAGTASTQSAQVYKVAIHTSNLVNAGTNGHVWLRINGSAGSSPLLGRLDDATSDFERGSVDSFSFTLPDLGTLRSIDLCFQDLNTSAWLPEYVSVNGSIAPINKWLDTNNNVMYCRTFSFTPARWYYVSIYTSTLANAGTNGHVWLRINGSARSSPLLGRLDDAATDFELGSVDNFSFMLPELGTLRSVEICFQDLKTSAWNLDKVIVNGVTVPVSDWFNTNGNVMYCRTFTP
jgi:PLAT/LH2 domain